MKLFSVLIASLTASVSFGQNIVPAASCGFFKQAQCAASLAVLVAEISSLPLPPTVDQVRAVLLNGQSFITECKDCIYENQMTLLCDTIDTYIEKASDVVGVDVDFDASMCKSEGVVAAVSDLIEDYLPPGGVGIMPVSPKGLSKDELENLEKVYSELYDGKADAPNKDELFKVIQDMASRPSSPVQSSKGGYGTLALRPCEEEIAIEAISIALSAIPGLPKGVSKKIAGKMWRKLKPEVRRKIIRIVREINTDNFVNKLYEVLKLIFENLSWNDLTDSFSSLGFWDALTFAASFAAIFASGGTAFLINLGLKVYDAAILANLIVNCFA